MFTLVTQFEELLKNIRPPQDRLDAAHNLPVLVRDYLAEHEDFETLAPHSRLVGSYAQQMCVGDVKDVDFLVRVDGDPDTNEPEAKQLIQDLEAALDDLPDALGYNGYADVDIKQARRSVHVHIEKPDFHLDVVPCIAPNGFDEPLYVPDRGFNKWIKSHPCGYTNLLNTLNGEHREKVKPLGKLLKHFRNHQMRTRRPKSYWLGALLVHHITREGGLNTAESLAELVCDLFDEIYRQYASLMGRDDGATPNISDPLLGHNISWNWGRTHFETFMRRVSEGREWAAKALNAKDRGAAIVYWQRIFGAEYFPSDVQEAASQAATAAWPGQASVTATGLVTLPQPAKILSVQPIKPVQSLETRFHGPSEE